MGKGFTLVEIMIVVMVISLIVAIAIPSYVSARRKSMMYACIGNLRQIDAAKQIWGVENSGDPEMSDLIPGYIGRTPACPSGGTYTLGSVAGATVCSVSGHVAGEDS